jgi:hypothetical protein
MTESLPLILLALAVAAIGAAAYFAYRSAGVDPIRSERDRAVEELKTLRQENARLAAELAAEKGASAGRSESEEARFLTTASLIPISWVIPRRNVMRNKTKRMG